MDKTDTTPDVRRVQYDLYRRMSAADKVGVIFSAYHTGQLLAMAGIKLLNPKATKQQLWQMWAKRHLGEELYIKVYGNPKDR